MPKDPEILAELTLGGEPITIGISAGNTLPKNVWYKTMDMAEPNYITVTEAGLLIAALRAAVAEAQEV